MKTLEAAKGKVRTQMFLYGTKQSLERQAKFLEWVSEVFVRAGEQNISLESLTEFELEWIARM